VWEGVSPVFHAPAPQLAFPAKAGTQNGTRRIRRHLDASLPRKRGGNRCEALPAI